VDEPLFCSAGVSPAFPARFSDYAALTPLTFALPSKLDSARDPD